MSNIVTESKSAGAAFIDAHEKLQNAYNESVDTITRLTTQATELHQRNEMLDHENKTVKAERNEFLQHSVELASHLQFMVSGCIRALQLAAKIKASVAAINNGGATVVTAPADEKTMATLDKLMKELETPIPDVAPAATEGVVQTAPPSMASQSLTAQAPSLV